jgi:hypothetical protein
MCLGLKAKAFSIIRGDQVRGTRRILNRELFFSKMFPSKNTIRTKAARCI